jgi:hypothetical protein
MPYLAQAPFAWRAVMPAFLPFGRPVSESETIISSFTLEAISGCSGGRDTAGFCHDRIASNGSRTVMPRNFRNSRSCVQI